MNKPKRVLHLPYTLSKGSGIMGVIMNIYKNIDREKIQFDFLCCIKCEESFEQEICAMGGRVYYTTSPKITTLHIFKRDIDNHFKQYAREYIAVHYHAISVASYALISARKHGIKYCISHSHATTYSDKKISKIRNYILCLPLKKQANIYFSCSKAAGYFLYGKKLMENNKVIIINNAIDCSKFTYSETKRIELRKKMDIEDRFIVGHVGRFANQKNHTFILDVFYEIKKRKANSILILVGDGELRESIQKKAESLGILNDIIFLGMRNDVDELLQVMDVFLLPSLFEGLPVIGVEAQATGIPCIMSDRITKEVDVIGVRFLSLEESKERWAEETIKIVEEHTYRNTTEEMRLAGFDIRIQAKELQEYYLSLKM